MNKEKWDIKTIRLGNAIVFAAVTLALGIVVGVNWHNFTSLMGAAIAGENHSVVDWSPLDEVYNKLANTYNGEVEVD